MKKSEGEGGCGVIGIASDERIAGKHLLSALQQMRNRGNGKGGGIAAAGMSAETFGISQEILENDYLLAIAFLDRDSRSEVESEFIHSVFDIDQIYEIPTKTLKEIEIAPPKAIVYFVRVKEEAVQSFRSKYPIQMLSKEAIEDEIVYQNSILLNRAFYASSGEKKAFVLSHGKDLLVLKIVGYGDDVIRCYSLEDFKAHVWIGHHRYPTKGKVWHPGGAHPFIGLHEALVHNGDFANYSSICSYLAERNIHPHFLTDTEVAVLLFDLFYRKYAYPLEYVIEALAPTTERDFTLLPADKRRIYHSLQKTHMQGSPDGPWFFLIAQSLQTLHKKRQYSLIGITDTSMLRPQVFALQKGEVSIGFAASEKQAIDATLRSLSQEDDRFWLYADHYWNARGGSYTDGGAFVFTVSRQFGGNAKLICTDKFGNSIHQRDLGSSRNSPRNSAVPFTPFPNLPAKDLIQWFKENVHQWDYTQVNGFVMALVQDASNDQNTARAIEIITHLMDYRYPTGRLRRSCLLDLFDRAIAQIAELIRRGGYLSYHFLGYQTPIRNLKLEGAVDKESITLVVDAKGFPAEGGESLAREIIKMFAQGFKKFIIVNCRGHRFIANGLGPRSYGVFIDVYGSSGDYLASGIDGAHIRIHGSAQDQLAQIMNEGTLIIYGDVGQTFMYGAKGGKAFILGNAAGRPLINAVGKPRIVINGTCLDYLAESFMAGNPLDGGGFAIINGVGLNEEGEIIEMDTPYAGNNLFSLASGGAIYIRDPARRVSEEQLNGGKFDLMTLSDWELILPYLKENESIFNIPVEKLLCFENKTLSFEQVYIKIIPLVGQILQEEEAWIKGKSPS